MSNRFILSCHKWNINSSSFDLIQKYMDCTHTVPTCVCMPQYAAEEAAAFLYISCPITKYILSSVSLLFSLPSSEPTTFHSSPLSSKPLKTEKD